MAEGKQDELLGKGKEIAGKLTDDEELEAEGKTDQFKGNVEQAGEKAKTRSRASVTEPRPKA